MALLDRARFPRDKPCGGGVLLSALNHIPFDISPVVEREIYGFRVRYQRDREFSHRHDQPLAVMTQRSRLDAFLAERAAQRGADLRDGLGVRAIESNGGVSVRTTEGDTLTAGLLIAADGANGIVRRSLGLPRLRAAVALEGNAERTQPASQRWSDDVGLELGSMRGGYGWVFPKGEHLNLGVGGYPAGASGLRSELADYTRSEDFDPAQLESLRAHHLPLRDVGQALTVGPIALVGDAAGLIDPLSGEGIGNAIRSGQLAAAAALELLDGAAADLSGYDGGGSAGDRPRAGGGAPAAGAVPPMAVAVCAAAAAQHAVPVGVVPDHSGRIDLLGLSRAPRSGGGVRGSGRGLRDAGPAESCRLATAALMSAPTAPYAPRGIEAILADAASAVGAQAFSSRAAASASFHSV